MIQLSFRDIFALPLKIQSEKFYDEMSDYYDDMISGKLNDCDFLYKQVCRLNQRIRLYPNENTEKYKLYRNTMSRFIRENHPTLMRGTEEFQKREKQKAFNKQNVKIEKTQKENAEKAKEIIPELQVELNKSKDDKKLQIELAYNEVLINLVPNINILGEKYYDFFKYSIDIMNIDKLLYKQIVKQLFVIKKYLLDNNEKFKDEYNEKIKPLKTYYNTEAQRNGVMTKRKAIWYQRKRFEDKMEPFKKRLLTEEDPKIIEKLIQKIDYLKKELDKTIQYMIDDGDKIRANINYKNVIYSKIRG